MVYRDQQLIVCRNEVLETRVKVLEARREELNVRLLAAMSNDRVQSEGLREELHSITVEIQRAQEEAKALVIRSNTDGILVLPNYQDLVGRYVKKGEILGYTLQGKETTARVVVPQGRIDLVEHGTRKIELRQANQVSISVQGRIQQSVPAATDRLPSLALSHDGGGVIVRDPRDTKSAKALEPFFMLDIDFPADAGVSHIGARVYVRFDHGYESLGSQLLRSGRQLFLTHFGI
jgi:putative peptide zinc metalloprotease protein